MLTHYIYIYTFSYTLIAMHIHSIYLKRNKSKIAQVSLQVHKDENYTLYDIIFIPI